jgi:NitT/TauT family transport system substrate-binding protein
MYATGGLVRARQAGYELNIIWPEDYNVRMYADTLITTDEMVTENPDLTLRFLRATLRGWQDAIENPETAVSATLKYALEADLETQSLMMDASLPLIHTGEDQIGWMRAEVWEGMHDILVEQGFLEQSFPFESTFTTQFLEDIYGKNP